LIDFSLDSHSHSHIGRKGSAEDELADRDSSICVNTPDMGGNVFVRVTKPLAVTSTLQAHINTLQQADTTQMAITLMDSNTFNH